MTEWGWEKKWNEKTHKKWRDPLYGNNKGSEEQTSTTLTLFLWHNQPITAHTVVAGKGHTPTSMPMLSCHTFNSLHTSQGIKILGCDARMSRIPISCTIKRALPGNLQFRFNFFARYNLIYSSTKTIIREEEGNWRPSSTAGRLHYETDHSFITL